MAARTAITPITVPGAYPGSTLALTWTAADAANGNSATMSGDMIVLVRNDNVAAQIVTFTSAADPFGRTSDVTISVPTGEYRVSPRFQSTGWKQSDGKLYFSAPETDVFLAVLKVS